MSLHCICINRTAFNNIKSNKKKIEGRLKKGYFINSKIKINDKILFYNKYDKYVVSVKDIIEYTSLYYCLENENLKDLLPHINNINDAYEYYKQFYSKENLKKYNFLAIKF
jgi:ASC-1-like (ASCH) protein